MGWPTVADCKAYSANIPEVANAVDSVIEGKIEDAKIFIKQYCKQEFDSPEEEVAKYFNGNDSESLDLYPRCYVMTVVLDGSYDMTDLVNLKYGDNFSYLEAKYPADSWEFDPRVRVRMGEDSFIKMFPFGSNNIEVIGNWDWVAIPDDIINACKQIVERLVIKNLDIRQWTTPFQSERTSDGYSYTKQVHSSILDYELTLTLNNYVFDLINVTKI